VATLVTLAATRLLAVVVVVGLEIICILFPAAAAALVFLVKAPAVQAVFTAALS
jgi:hypothetical protein